MSSLSVIGSALDSGKKEKTRAQKFLKSGLEVNIRVQRARLWVTPERGYFTQNRIS
jgi:hypothetical protein